MINNASAVLLFSAANEGTYQQLLHYLTKETTWGRAPVGVVHVSLGTEYKVDHVALQF